MADVDINNPRVPDTFFENADGTVDFFLPDDRPEGNILVKFEDKESFQSWAESLAHLARRAKPALFQSATADFETYSLRP